MSDAIQMNKVRKAFGPKVAVEGIDLNIPMGSIYGFIGPNGAGKTTTIRMIMSILFPDSGELSVLGKKSAVESKDRIGYLPEERGVYKKMKVASFLMHMGRLKGLDAQGLRPKVQDWLERVELGDVAKKKCEELSKGMQQKVQFIASVLHDPDLIILDEPFSGLDPVNMRLLRDLIEDQHTKGKTVIFSTHVMQQAEQICEHIVMIHEGKKVLDDTLDTIRTRFDPHAIHVDTIDPSDQANAISAVPGIASVHRHEGIYEVKVAESVDQQQAMQSILSHIQVSSIEIKRPTLEDVFIEIVTGGAQSDDQEQLRAQLLAGSKNDEEQTS
ncbi:MAG: ABC transporter ATP-binding protein [Phycisphaerales bacterium]